MVTPILSRKKGSEYQLTEQGKNLFKVIYQQENQDPDKDKNIPKIKVSDLVSKMAFYYEKLRNTVEYEEEHLLRKRAIERILKRQIVIEKAMSFKEIDSLEISQHLLTELIRAGYLPNNQIPESMFGEIAELMRKYILLRKCALENLKNKLNATEYAEKKTIITHWILALAASDIEERLGRNKIELTEVDYMYDILDKIILLPENSPFEKDKKIQIYVSIHRNLFKFDDEMLSFLLFKYYIPKWPDLSDQEINNIALNIFPLMDAIENQLDNPIAPQLNRIVSRYTIFFTILVDVIKEDPQKVYDCIQNDPKAFPRLIKNTCKKKYKQSRKRLWRTAVRSILYILVTKSLFVFLMEVPIAQIFNQQVNDFSLIINISFPATLLLLVAMFTRLPGDANSDQIVKGIEEVLFVGQERKDPYKLRMPVKRRTFLEVLFKMIYAITFLASFGFVIWALDKLGFNWISIIIFLFFLAFVSFFSTRIVRGAHELLLVEPRENIFSFFLDFFWVPIVSTGKWLSDNFDRVNIFVFIMDVIIEAPFKILIEITEEWTKYVKERKDDLV